MNLRHSERTVGDSLIKAGGKGGREKVARPHHPRPNHHPLFDQEGERGFSVAGGHLILEIERTTMKLAETPRPC